MKTHTRHPHQTDTPHACRNNSTLVIHNKSMPTCIRIHLRTRVMCPSMVARVVCGCGVCLTRDDAKSEDEHHVIHIEVTILQPIGILNRCYQRHHVLYACECGRVCLALELMLVIAALPRLVSSRFVLADGPCSARSHSPERDCDAWRKKSG